MSYLSKNIAQQHLILQAEKQAFNQTKFAVEQQNFERKMQADIMAELRRNEASVQVANIQAQSQLETKALDGILQGINQTQAFFLAELAKQSQHCLDAQRLVFETRANSILERLRNNQEKELLEKKAEYDLKKMVFEHNCRIIEKVLESELKDKSMTSETALSIAARLTERDFGLQTSMFSENEIREAVNKMMRETEPYTGY